MFEITCGIDEAGRGPVIGPMVLGCAVFDRKGVEKLSELKVRDSKKVSPARRRYLEPFIKKIALEYKIVCVSASEIDLLRRRKTLNEIEAMKMAELICSLKAKPNRIIVDAADSVAENYRTKVIFYIKESGKNFKIPEIVSEHKADDKYIEVGAASILAKVERDRQVDALKEKHGDFGSGYPSDETTKKYIQKIVREGNMPGFVRRSWSTVNKVKQKKLGEY
ncbi:MAG: ribonuclease HII [Candidatus Altiarchaeota archaeon]